MNAADDTPKTVTRLLLEWREGDAQALEALVPLVYDELRRLARLQMRDQAAGHTLQPTALVHEAYARLVGLKLDWQNRTHFLSMAARTMPQNVAPAPSRSLCTTSMQRMSPPSI